MCRVFRMWCAIYNTHVHIKRSLMLIYICSLPPVSKGKVEQEADNSEHNSKEGQEVVEGHEPEEVGVNYHHRCAVRWCAICRGERVLLQ